VVHGFLARHDLAGEYRLNMEANHATLSGHSFHHEIAYAVANGILGSIDTNRGDYQNGWDTDQFPNSVDELALAMDEIVRGGGLTTGAVGTALLGRSPDSSTRAVFAVVCADGSLIQAHTQQGVDGLAPAGTVTSLLSTSNTSGTSDDLRVGVVWNFEPVRTLFLSDPIANAVVTLNVLDDGQIFRPGDVGHLSSPSFKTPIGLAPANPETEDTDQASNTTLAENSDIYVANRGDNTVVRIHQDGTVAAERQVSLSGSQTLGGGRLSGIAVSPDGSRIWVTVTGELPGFAGLDGAVLELPAFGAS